MEVLDYTFISFCRTGAGLRNSKFEFLFENSLAGSYDDLQNYGGFASLN